MATTTNYGWTTPDDTALVKDGAAAIRTLGSSVDTTTKNLNPETTLGDIAYRSSTPNVNTRLALGTAGQVLKVNSGATAPEWATDNSGMTNPMTTTGDTIYSSSGSTPARLGIGSTGQVLTVAAGVPSWATPTGDYVKITSADFSSVSSVTLNDVFSSTYNNYKLFITTTSSPGAVLRARYRVSGSDASGSDYEWTRLYTSGSTVGAAGASSQTSADISDTGVAIAADITIYRPYLTEATLTTGYNLYNAPTSGTDHGFYVSAHNQATSYTGITFFPSTSTMSGNYALYGLRA
jgi:hypothetical protein